MPTMAKKPTMPKPLMRISAAAEAAGVSTRTVEYYILIGLVRPIHQPDKPGRYFDAALVRRIRLIKRLNNSGYTLRDIRETYLRKK